MKNITFSNTSPQLPKTKSGIGLGDLNLALAEATKCGNGINPKKGYVKLPNYNSISGDIDGEVGLYIVDGLLVVEPIEDVLTAINGFCNNAAVSATGVTITGCVGTTLASGTRQLTAVVAPTGASQTGTWTSSVPARATVSSTGLVTWVGGSAGATTITFTSTDGGFTATCVVTVAAA